MPRTAAARTFFALCLIVAVALRLWDLGDAPPLGNEYFYFYLSLHPSNLVDFLRGIRGNPLHLLVTQLLPYWIARWTASPGWLRLPSALFGCAGVVGLWRVAGFGGVPRRGEAAAFLLAISLLHVEWSGRLELYAASCALTLAATDAYLRLPRGRGLPWEYTGWSTVMIYTSPFALPVALLHALDARLDPARGRFRQTVAVGGAWTVASALFVPWLVFTGSRMAPMLRSGLAVGPTGAEFLATIPLFFAHGSELTRGLGTWGEPLPAVLALLYAGAWAISLSRFVRRGGDPALRLAHVVVPGGIVAVTAIDVVTKNYFAPRQLLWVLPFYLLCVADGFLYVLEQTNKKIGTSPVPVTFAAALSFAVMPLYMRCHAEQRQASDGIRTIVNAIVRGWRDGDVVEIESSELAQNVMFHFDEAAFESPVAFRRLPVPLIARRGGRLIRFRVMDYENSSIAFSPGRTWRLRGRMYDLTAQLPAGMP